MTTNLITGHKIKIIHDVVFKALKGGFWAAITSVEC